MKDPVSFLQGFAHAVGTMTLYPEGHRLREEAIDAAYELLDECTTASGTPAFTFLDEQVVYGQELLRELKAWSFGRRLVSAGIERLEFERQVTRAEFESLLEEIFGRVVGGEASSGDARQMRSLGARFGPVEVAKTDENDEEGHTIELATTTLELALGDEAETFRWMQREVEHGGTVSLQDAGAVIRSLSVAMHGDSHFVIPLLQLKEFDQYTTTHSLNVAVLALALAEQLGYGPEETRAIGVAGLLHDIGKTRIPLDILTKPGKLTSEERAVMNRHPIDGAKILLESTSPLGLAATVAHEHHIMLDGGGYPRLYYQRECAMASRLVHVCDVFDALSTKRPYRDAWPLKQTLDYLGQRAGGEFDPDIVTTFIELLRENGARVCRLDESGNPLSGHDL